METSINTSFGEIQPRNRLMVLSAVAGVAFSALVLAKGSGEMKYDKPVCKPGMHYVVDGTESLTEVLDRNIPNNPNTGLHEAVLQKEIEYFNPTLATDTDLPKGTMVTLPDCPTDPTIR